MRETSDLHKELFANPNHWTETRLAIGDAGVIVDNNGRRITFGGVAIRAGTGAEAGFGESMLMTLGTDLRVFSEDTPTLGSCAAGEITVKMLKPVSALPRQARLIPYVRLTDGARHSEWIQKGVYYIDTRKIDSTSETKYLDIHGYDAMLKAEVDYPSSTLAWPAVDIRALREIAAFMGVDIDPRTVALINKGYDIPAYPAGYSCREVLGYIAAMYGGCFIMNDLGQLRLIQLAAISNA